MTDLKKMVRDAKSKAKKMETENIFKVEHMNTVKSNLLNDVRKAANNHYSVKLYELQKKQNDIIKKHNPSAVKALDKPKATMTIEQRYAHLSPEWLRVQVDIDKARGVLAYDVDGLPITDKSLLSDDSRVNPYETKTQNEAETSHKLLTIKQWENQARASRLSDLEKEIDKLHKTKSGNVEQLNIISVELRNRGAHEQADMLQDAIEGLNLREPWKNDTEFKGLEHDIAKFKGFMYSDDVIFLDDSGQEHVGVDTFWLNDDDGLSDVSRVEVDAVVENN